MIVRIKGNVLEKSPTSVIVECGGLGYNVNISLNTFSKIKDYEEVSLYTYLLIKEDEHSLYGFYEEKEREMFVLLVSVSGIGANTARTLLSSLDYAKIAIAIINEKVEVIQSVKGIGTKTAQRTILELKDKVLKSNVVENEIEPSAGRLKKEVILALEVLGINKRQADKIIDKILEKTPNLTVEETIKSVLKSI